MVTVLALPAVPSSPTSWDLGPRQYLAGDSLVFKSNERT